MDVRFPKHIPIKLSSLAVSLGTIRFNVKNFTFCLKSVLHVASLAVFITEIGMCLPRGTKWGFT